MSKKMITGKLFSFLLLAIGISAQAAAVPLTHYNTYRNTDVVTAGTGGLRGTGTGVINVAGVSGPVTSSLLYWHGPTNLPASTASANGNVNGAALTGTNIGTTFDNAWSYANGQAYRADASAVINANGAYNLTGFVTPDAEANGAAAVVFFNDANTANNRDVYIYDGNDAGIAFGPDNAGWDVDLSGISYIDGAAFLRLLVTDGQVFSDGILQLNGITIAESSIFQGNTLPGASFEGEGNLFDIVSFDITAFMQSGVNDLTLTLARDSDAISLIGAIVDVAARPVPTDVPEPLTLGLVALGALAMGTVRRRRSM